MTTDDGASSLVLPAASFRPFLEALEFAAEKQFKQRRKAYARLPYVNHLIKVATALVEVAGESDVETLQAAVLHDIVEDTDVTPEDLSDRFGAKVAGIVVELTDDMHLPQRERRRLQWERAPGLSPEAKKIRLADKACNMLDLIRYPVSWTMERKLAYVDSSARIVAALGAVDERLEQWFGDVVEEVRDRLGGP